LIETTLSEVLDATEELDDEELDEELEDQAYNSGGLDSVKASDTITRELEDFKN
jgi:hypothetical protein